jgi:hypothetical protein
MPTYYAFKVTLGRQRVTSDTALIVTDDRTGEKLPKPRSGSCKFLRAITLIPKSGDKVIVSHDDAMAAIGQKGFYQVPSRYARFGNKTLPLGQRSFAGP